MKTFKDLPYLDDGNVRHTFDLYLPESDNFSLFIYFHGGGIEAGSKLSGERMAEYLTDRNIALMSANYRLYPNAVYPEFIRDAASATAWAFAHIKEYGACDKIYVGGSSAGAYLSLMLCFDSKYLAPHKLKPTDIAGFVHDGGQPTAHFNVLRERGIKDFDKRVIIDDTCPIYYIGQAEDYSPMVLLTATNDMKNRYEQNILLKSTMKHYGFEDKVELKYLKGTHGKYEDFTLAELVYEFISNN